MSEAGMRFEAEDEGRGRVLGEPEGQVNYQVWSYQTSGEPLQPMSYPVETQEQARKLADDWNSSEEMDAEMNMRPVQRQYVPVRAITRFEVLGGQG